MIRMNICGGYRLCGVGMLWIGGLILGPFATALMPLRPFILESYFDPTLTPARYMQELIPDKIIAYGISVLRACM